MIISAARSPEYRPPVPAPRNVRRPHGTRAASGTGRGRGAYPPPCPLPVPPTGPPPGHFIRVAHSWTFAMRVWIWWAVASALGGPPQTRRSSLWITPCGLPLWWV